MCARAPTSHLPPTPTPRQKCKKVGFLAKKCPSPANWVPKFVSNFLFEPQTNIQVQPLSKRTPVTYMAYKFYLSKLAKQLELKYCHILGKLATRPENCRSRSVVYLAN